MILYSDHAACTSLLNCKVGNDISGDGPYNQTGPDEAILMQIHSFFFFL